MPFTYRQTTSGVDTLFEHLRSEYPQALPWQVLCLSIMKGHTKRSTLERVQQRFFQRWPQPDLVAIAEEEEVAHYCKALSMQRTRAERLVNMSVLYAQALFKHPRELPGVGPLGLDAWTIYVEGKLPKRPPANRELRAVFCALGGVTDDDNAGGISGSRAMARFAGCSPGVVLKAIRRGDLNAKFIGGSRGYITTKRELLRWAEDA